MKEDMKTNQDMLARMEAKMDTKLKYIIAEMRAW
jgi:hypothetical protein